MRLAAPLMQLRQLSPRWLFGFGLMGLALISIPGIRSQSITETATEAAASEGILPVETVTATSVDYYEVSRTYTGEVASLQASELGFERSGQITELLVSEGAQVQAGSPLARLDVRNLQTQRLQIEAEKARANAQLLELEAGARSEDIAAARFAVQDLEQQAALQKTQVSRRQMLYENGAISREQLDEFKFGEGSLQARLSQARSELQELKNGTRPEQILAQRALIQQLDARIADLDVTLSKSTLSAPFSGTVAEHKVDTGTVVGAGQSVIRLIEDGIPEARIGVPADVVNRLEIGEERIVELTGEMYTATISSILPEVDAQTRTQTVVLSLESRAATQVNPGQTVRLDVTERIQTAGIWLPVEALTQGIRGLWSAYVVLPTEASIEAAGEIEYVVQPQSVEVVHQAGDRVLVTGTIQPNEKIVASGSHRLVPGQQVSLTEQSSQAFIAD